MYDPTLPPGAPQQLALQTRKGGVVANWMHPSESYAGLDLQVQDLKNKHKSAMHRDVGPSPLYNCHGLTFAARRTGIYKPGQIQKILDEDGYAALSFTERPICGDIAIYVEDRDIIHSGVVVAVREDIPWILGKWGMCHEAIHKVKDCPYPSATVFYYRLKQ